MQKSHSSHHANAVDPEIDSTDVFIVLFDRPLVAKMTFHTFEQLDYCFGLSFQHFLSISQNELSNHV